MVPGYDGWKRRNIGGRAANRQYLSSDKVIAQKFSSAPAAVASHANRRICALTGRLKPSIFGYTLKRSFLQLGGLSGQASQVSWVSRTGVSLGAVRRAW